MGTIVLLNSQYQQQQNDQTHSLLCLVHLPHVGGQDGGALTQHRECGALGHCQGLWLETEPDVSCHAERQSSKLTSLISVRPPKQD